MNTQKGLVPVAIILAVIGILLVGSGAYYLAKNYKLKPAENPVTSENIQKNTQPEQPASPTKSKEQPTSTATKQPSPTDETANWKTYRNEKYGFEVKKACTQEVKQCPDGSYVSRTGPNCEFAECPGAKEDTTNSQKYFSCRQVGGNNRVNRSAPYKKGSIVFKAKDGTSEETILNKLKPLGYDLKTVNSAWGYSGVDRSTLFIKYLLKPDDILKLDDIKKLIIPIVDKYGLAYNGFYYSSADIIFVRLLDENERESINTQLSSLISQGIITEFSWNYTPKQLYGFLPTPVGREEEYIEKLKNLGIFDCVSRELNIVPFMPSPLSP